jgi:hypothetical protein
MCKGGCDSDHETRTKREELSHPIYTIDLSEQDGGSELTPTFSGFKSRNRILELADREIAST